MSSCQCRGEGLYFDEKSAVMRVCDCPAGFRRKEYFQTGEAEKKKAAAAEKRKRGRKRREPEELPF